MNRHSPRSAPPATTSPAGARPSATDGASDRATAGAGARRGEARADSGKRARILDAAVRVFAEKGFWSAKVAEIARVAGVADGTIYLYFKSKDDILISLFEDRMEQVNDSVRAALAEDVAPVEKLRRWVRVHLALVEENRHLAEVLIVELRQSSKFIKEYAAPKFGEFLRLLAGAVEEGQRDGSIRRDLDPAVVARALFGALDELALAWLLRTRPPGTKKGGAQAHASAAEERFELTRVAEQLGDLFIEGLRNR